MFTLELKKKTQELGEALDAARKISVKMKKEPEKASELQVSFDKAMEHFTKTKLETQRLEKQQAIEDENRKANEPTDPIPHLAPNVTDRDKKIADEKDWQDRHKKAFGEYMRSGPDSAKECFKDYGRREKHALLGTQADLGGFLIPDDFRAEIIRNVAGLSAFVAAGARVVPTSLRVLTFPTIKVGSGDEYPTDLQQSDSQVTGATRNWKGEGLTTGGNAPPLQTKPTFGQENIPVHLWQPDVVELTRELLDDSVVPLESVLAELFGEIMALDTTWAYTNGDGVGKPEGVLEAGITTADSGLNADVTYGGLVDWFYGLPAQYRATSSIMLTSALFAKIVQVENDTDNRHLIFVPQSPPGQLFQRPVVFNEFLPALATDSLSGIVGDFRHFIVAERNDMRIQRLVERFAPNVGILPTARIGGQVTRTAAFRVLKLAT